MSVHMANEYGSCRRYALPPSTNDTPVCINSSTSCVILWVHPRQTSSESPNPSRLCPRDLPLTSMRGNLLGIDVGIQSGCRNPVRCEPEREGQSTFEPVLQFATRFFNSVSGSYRPRTR